MSSHNRVPKLPLMKWKAKHVHIECDTYYISMGYSQIIIIKDNINIVQILMDGCWWIKKHDPSLLLQQLWVVRSTL